MKKVILSILSLIIIINCSSSKYKTIGNVTELKLEFADPSKWDGIKIPPEGWGLDIGGPGFSPALIVKNIPDGTNAIIVEFNDLDYSELSVGGGHGAIYVNVNNQKEVTIPSVKERSADLPEGVFMEHTHHANITPKTAYLAPGSGSHRYNAIISAVYKAESEKEKSVLLGKATLYIGSPSGNK